MRTTRLKLYILMKSYGCMKSAHVHNTGLFLVRLIALNAGELTASEIVLELWQLYRSHASDIGAAAAADEQPANSENLWNAYFS